MLLALSPAVPAGLGELLFGDVLGVSDGDLLFAALLVAVVVGALALLHGRLLVVGFDRTSARGLGVAPALVDAALLVLLAAGACSSPCRAWATCSSSPCSSPRPRPRAC